MIIYDASILLVIHNTISVYIWTNETSEISCSSAERAYPLHPVPSGSNQNCNHLSDLGHATRGKKSIDARLWVIPCTLGVIAHDGLLYLEYTTIHYNKDVWNKQFIINCKCVLDRGVYGFIAGTPGTLGYRKYKVQDTKSECVVTRRIQRWQYRYTFLDQSPRIR